MNKKTTGLIQIAISGLIIIVCIVSFFAVPKGLEAAEAEINEEDKAKPGYQEGKDTLVKTIYALISTIILLSIGLLLQGILNLGELTQEKKPFKVIKKTSSSLPK